jgi:hypothetical protein
MGAIRSGDSQTSDYYVGHEQMHASSQGQISDQAATSSGQGAYHNTQRYNQLTPAQRLLNADSYACFLTGC